MGIHSLMHNVILYSMTSSFDYGMVVLRKQNHHLKPTKQPVTTGRHDSNADIRIILSVSDQHLHATVRACPYMSTYRFGPSETRYLLCHNNIIICRPRYQMYLYDIINGYLFLIQMGNHELHSQSNTEAYTSTKQTVKVVFQESMNTLQYLSIIYKEVFLSFGVLHHRSQS